MIKVSVSDLMAILARFDLATDDNKNREIDQIRKTSPDDQSTLVAFRFKKTKFYVLLDHRVDDEEAYVRSVIADVDANAKGILLENPHGEVKTFGLPFKGKEVYLFEVTSNKRRLDVELSTRYPAISRSTWQKYIKEGYVSVNKEVQTQNRLDVEETDDLSFTIPEKTDFAASELPIIFMDDNVIVINKPIGMLSHSKGALNDEFTVADFFRRYCYYHADSNRPGIVHRLDRDTSGVMIGARNDETAALLQAQFADRKTSKTYYAVLKGIPKNDKAIIDLPIARNPALPSTFRVDSKGKSAVTSYEVIAQTDKFSLVKLNPRTGRTHQLRVHMAYLNTPILGDRVYGKAADRLYLHAASLEITIPVSDRRTFTAPLPESFTDLFPESKLKV